MATAQLVFGELSGGGGKEIEIAYSTRDSGTGWQPITLATKDSVIVYGGVNPASGNVLSVSGGSSSMTVTALVPCTVYYAENSAAGASTATTTKDMSTGETLTLSVATGRCQTVAYAVAK